MHTADCNALPVARLRPYCVEVLTGVIALILLVVVVALDSLHNNAARENIVYCAATSFAVAIDPVTTNANGQVVQPKEFNGEMWTPERHEFWRKYGNLQTVANDLIHNFMASRYDPITCFLSERKDFDLVQVSNTFSLVRSEISRTPIPVVRLHASSENPKLAVAVLTFLFKAYGDSLRRFEERLTDLGLSKIRTEIETLKRELRPTELKEKEYEDVLRRVKAQTVRLYMIESPHVLCDQAEKALSCQK